MTTFRTQETTHVLTARRTLGHVLEEQVVLIFEWAGGAYIEVRRENHQPSEVINVWDYQKSQSRMPFTRNSLVAEVTRWISEYGPAMLRHDVLNNW